MALDKYEVLMGFFPQISKPGRCKPEFNWFLFSKRLLDPKTNLFYVAVPPITRFFSEKTFTTVNVKDTSTDEKKMGLGEYPRLLLLNDVHNKKVLCQMYGECVIGCTSNKTKLSRDCTIVKNKKRLGRLVTLARKLHFDGVAYHHVNCKPGLKPSSFPLCTEATFVIAKRKLQKTPSGGCKIVRYAKLHNTSIRRKIKDFPRNPEIDEMMKKRGCKYTTKVLYKSLLVYASSHREL